MSDNENPPKQKKLKPHIKRLLVRLKIGAERNKFFDEVEKEWEGTYNKFAVNMTLKPEQREEKYMMSDIQEDVLNPEIKLSREDYNNEHSWIYWKIYSISYLDLEIEFSFRRNSPNDAAKVMKGNIERFIDDRLVSYE